MLSLVDFGAECLLLYGDIRALWRRKPQHTSETLASTTPGPSRSSPQVIDESNWRYNQAFEEALAWDKTGKLRWNSSVVWAARVSFQLILGFRACQAQRSFSQEKDTRQSRVKRCCSSFNICSLASRCVDPVEPCQSTCLCSQTSRASLPCLIDLPSKSLQVPVAHWRTRLGANEKRCSFSHCFENEARNKWLLRSHVARIWLMRIFLITGRLTYTPGSLAAKTSKRTLWERLSAELYHQPYPLTPVLVEKISVVFKGRLPQCPLVSFVKPHNSTGGFWKTFRSPNPRCRHCGTPTQRLIGGSDRRRDTNGIVGALAAQN